jgi:hypothetical protein
MKMKLAVIALGALALMANGANAQHRTSNAHVRLLPHIFAKTYAYAPRQEWRRQSLNNVYESFSQGRQSYPNPDRQFGGPNSSGGGE